MKHSNQYPNPGSVFIWMCERGHEFAISDIVMKESKFEPRCLRYVDDDYTTCNAKLIERLRRI